MWNFWLSVAYRVWFQRMSAPRWRRVGLLVLLVVVGDGDCEGTGTLVAEEEAAMVVEVGIEGGAGRPASWGVGVDADI
jgi:hypothetical protein